MTYENHNTPPDELSLVVLAPDPDRVCWSVWVGPRDCDPLTEVEGFLIGIGASSDLALADARANLIRAAARLQHGDRIEVRH